LNIFQSKRNSTAPCQEFKSILKDYEVKIWLAAMDLDVSDVEELFQMLDDGQAGDSSRWCPLKKGRNPWGNHGKHGDFTRKMVITWRYHGLRKKGLRI
jgi:hypothetical protein